MKLTVVLKGMICLKPTSNLHAVTDVEMRVRVSTGEESTLGYKVLGEFGLGKFVQDEVKKLNITLYSGDPATEPTPFVRLYFYERVMDFFDYPIGLGLVGVKNGKIYWKVGTDTEDKGTVHPGDYDFNDFDGSRRFLMKGTGGLYLAFITAQLSL